MNEEQFRVSGGTGSWHPAWKSLKSLPRGAPSQDRDAGSNPAGATNLFSLTPPRTLSVHALGHVSGSTPNLIG